MGFAKRDPLTFRCMCPLKMSYVTGVNELLVSFSTGVRVLHPKRPFLAPFSSGRRGYLCSLVFIGFKLCVCLAAGTRWPFLVGGFLLSICTVRIGVMLGSNLLVRCVVLN